MSEQTKLTATCPYCKARIAYSPDAESAKCGYCDAVISVAELKAGKAKGQTNALTAIVASIDNAEAGLAYAETFFEGYDWSDFAHSPEVCISTLTDMVETQKIKSANNPATWLLEFRSVAVPLVKKTEGLALLEKEIEDDLISGEIDSYEAFDAYKSVVFALGEKKDALLATLENDIKFAEKYGAPASAVAEMKETVEALKKQLQAVCKEIKTPEDIAEVAAWSKKQQKKIEDDYRSKGVDAFGAYEAGVAMMKSSADKAMEQFEKIRDYKDTTALIAKMSKTFKVGDLWELAGRRYLVKADAALSLGALADAVKKKDEEAKAEETAQPAEDDGIRGFSFFEITDGVVAEKPAFTGVTTILGVYGSKIYYMKKRKAICYFDVMADLETEVDAAKADDYALLRDDNGDLLTLDHGSKYLFKKKLNLPIFEAKTGCLAAIMGLFGKKDPVVNYDNNFALLSLDLRTGTANALVDELIDTEFVTADKIFYKESRLSEDGKKKDILFRVVDTATGEKKDILDEHADIHTVSGDKVIYSRWTPNSLNMNLHVFDFKTEEDLVLEENIYNYMTLIGDRVYYTVGNCDFNPLFAINLDGTDRKEIMENVEAVRFVRGNWLYIVKGTKDNKTLVKLSTDGETRICVITQLKEIVKFTPSQIYYTDIFGNLCVVRNDGTEDKVIAKNLPAAPRGSDAVIVDTDYIYYLRNENIGRMSQGVNDEGAANYKIQRGYSLYRMDLDGHNVKKLIFNVTAMKGFDEDKIYFLQKENRSYRVSRPLDKKGVEVTMRTCAITSYMSLDKKTCKAEPILVLGLPDAETATVKVGCLGKTADKEVTFEEIPTKVEFENTGSVAAGAIHEEKEAAAQ